VHAHLPMNSSSIHITPPTRWHLLDARELWHYRELAVALMVRDIKVRYRQTMIGLAWAVLKPVMTMIVFTIVFSHIVKVPSDGYPYPVFLYSALLPWQFFSNALGSAANSVAGSRDLITRVYFPRLIIPVASVGACVVDMFVSMGVLIVLMIIYQISPTGNLLMVPLLLLMVSFAALGVGILVAALSVAFRDFIHLMPFGLQLWLFLTPVVYSTSIIPQHWQWLAVLNPMSGLTDGFRSAFLGLPFNLSALAISGVCAMAMFALGILVFERVERGFADVI
jgi:lipopolysaccharide transport system permease protein